MKKPGFLNKITIIDILIIICIIGAVGFAIYHMVDDDSSKATATSFDYSTSPKIIAIGQHTAKIPTLVATPLPPLKSKKNGKI